MREFYAKSFFSWLLILVVGAVGCHQEPVVPTSAIPLTCQIYRVATINEGVRDTTTFQYNYFGNLTEMNYRQWVNGALATSSVQKFAYTNDYFLTIQTDQTTIYPTGGNIPNQTSKTYNYIYQDGQVQQVAINNTQSGQPVGFWQYTYENGSVKTYIETDAQKKPVRTYTFNGAGRLTQFAEQGTGADTPANGKITGKTLADGTKINFVFDSQGQLLSETSTTTTGQTVRTYSYDQKPYWNKTQLLQRGIPPLDLGGHTPIHNVISSSVKQTLNGRIVQDQRFTYQLKYNDAGYVLGYARSDGAQQKIVYANCL